MTVSERIIKASSNTGDRVGNRTSARTPSIPLRRGGETIRQVLAVFQEAC